SSSTSPAPRLKPRTSSTPPVRPSSSSRASAATTTRRPPTPGSDASTRGKGRRDLMMKNWRWSLVLILALAVGAFGCSGYDANSSGSSSGGSGSARSSGGSSGGSGLYPDGGGGCPTSSTCQTCLHSSCQSQLDGMNEEGQAKTDFNTVATCICGGRSAGDCEPQADAQMYFPVQTCGRTNCPAGGF